MFTGIVEEIGKVTANASRTLEISVSRALADVKPGDSMSVNGACLTVVKHAPSTNPFATLRAKGSPPRAVIKFNVVPETLRRTDLGKLKKGDVVNLERALRPTDRMGGHMVQGHVEGTGRIARLVPQKLGKVAWIAAPASLMRYVVSKGFVAVDGVSLTVVECGPSPYPSPSDRARGEMRFSVALVPYTLAHTNLGTKKVGDVVNLETDVMARYMEKLLDSSRKNGAKDAGGVTWALLEKEGFLNRRAQ